MGNTKLHPITVILEPQVHADLEIVARDQNISRGKLARHLITEGVKRMKEFPHGQCHYCPAPLNLEGICTRQGCIGNT